MAGWQDAPAAWEDAPAAKGWEEAPESGFLGEAKGALKRAGTAIADKPLTAIPGAAEAFAGGVGSLGEMAAGGISGLARGAVGALPGGEGFGEGFTKGKGAAEETLAPLMKVFQPETDVGKALLDVLGLAPGAAKAAGETTYEKTKSPTAGAGVETLLDALMMFGPKALRRKAPEPVERPPLAGSPAETPAGVGPPPAPVAPPAPPPAPEITPPAPKPPELRIVPAAPVSPAASFEGAEGFTRQPPAGGEPVPAPAAGEPPVGMQPRAQRGGPPAPIPEVEEPVAVDAMPAERKLPNPIADSVRKVFAPATRGAEAGQTAGIVRENAAELARSTQVAQLRLEKFGSAIDKLPEAERYAFIDAIESGRPQDNPKLQPVADEMRAMLDERRVAVQKLGTGALVNFIEDYFPHIWKDPAKASAAMEQIARAEFGKRPLTGPGSFLKQRTIPTVRQGLAYGLEPVTSNPIDLTLLKIREMDRFIMGTRVMQEMKATGLAQFVRFGRASPEGWRRIDDKSARVLQWDEQAQGFIERGHYYAPEESARIINNYLKPGLAGDPLYDTVRGAGNLLNLAQLGFSAFHLGFTTMDAMVSKTALGIEQLARGELTQGATNVAKGMLVSEAVANVWRGEKLYRAYMNPGTGGPLLESIVDGLVKGGGRVKMDQFYNATRGGSYWNSIANQRFLHELTKNGVARGVAEFFPRLVQTISAPIMEYIVPRQKLGVFFDLYRDALEKEPNMGPERQRVVAGKIWDSVDNRLGELVYDNLFWNKVIKDLAFVSVRSVGWNLGTIREIGGGAIDYAKAAGDVVQGKAPDFTHKMAYVAALPVVAGLYGAIIQYLYTGEPPKEVKDMYFPKTGRITKEGYPERLSPPTYMKDIVEYYHAPGQTVVNKMNPLVSTMAQMYRNEDFFGAQIRDQDADALKQTEQTIHYLARQLMPFSYRGFQRQKEEGQAAGPSALSFFGLNPAPAFITRPPEVNRELERRRDLPAIRKRLRQEAKDAAE